MIKDIQHQNSSLMHKNKTEVLNPDQRKNKELIPCTYGPEHTQIINIPINTFSHFHHNCDVNTVYRQSLHLYNAVYTMHVCSFVYAYIA